MKRVSDVFTASISAILVVSVLFSIGGIAFSRQIAAALGANQELLDGTASYIRGVSIGFPFMMTSGICYVYFFMSSAYKYLKAIGAGSVVLFILLDVLAGIIHPSLFTFALATSIGYVISCAATLICLFKCSQTQLWNGFSFRRPSQLVEIIKDGRSVIVKKCCSMLRPILMNIITVAVGGTMAAAAFSVRSGIHFLLSTFALSMGSSLMMTVRYLYASQDRKGIVYTAKYVTRAYFLLGTVISAALFFAAPLVARVYGYDSGELFDKTVLLLRCTAVELMFYGYVGMYVLYLNAIRRQWLAVLLTLINNLLSLLVTAWLLVRICGGEGLWYVYLAASVLSFLALSAARIINYCRSGRSADSEIFLNRWEGAKDEDVLAQKLTDREQLPGFIDEVIAYCGKIGLSKKTGNRCCLALEELATNFFEHGISGKEKKFFYAHLAYADGKLHITVNDNCRHFSLMKYLNQINSEGTDPAKGIGIKLVIHSSDTIDYSSSFDMNCVNVTMNNTE